MPTVEELRSEGDVAGDNHSRDPVFLNCAEEWTLSAGKSGHRIITRCICWDCVFPSPAQGQEIGFPIRPKIRCARIAKQPSPNERVTRMSFIDV
jgi:hypothetical protein